MDTDEPRYYNAEDITTEQRERIAENLVAADAYLDELLSLLREHRKVCQDKACTSPKVEIYLNIDRDHTEALLRIAMERLVAKPEEGTTR